MALLTADDVLTVKFEVPSFKEGYKQDEVDVLLDDMAITIREFEERLGMSQESSDSSLRKAETLLTAEGVRNIRFSTTWWSGCRVDQVDVFVVQVLAAMRALKAQVRISSFAGQPGAGAGAAYDGAYDSGAYGTSPAQTGYAPGGVDGAGDVQYAEAIAQHDQCITQLQQENAYFRAKLESAQYCLGMIGCQSPSTLRSPRLRSKQGIVANRQGP